MELKTRVCEDEEQDEDENRVEETFRYEETDKTTGRNSGTRTISY